MHQSYGLKRPGGVRRPHGPLRSHGSRRHARGFDQSWGVFGQRRGAFGQRRWPGSSSASGPKSGATVILNMFDIAPHRRGGRRRFWPRFVQLRSALGQLRVGWAGFHNVVGRFGVMASRLASPGGTGWAVLRKVALEQHIVYLGHVARRAGTISHSERGDQRKTNQRRGGAVARERACTNSQQTVKHATICRSMRVAPARRARAHARPTIRVPASVGSGFGHRWGRGIPRHRGRPERSDVRSARVIGAGAGARGSYSGEGLAPSAPNLCEDACPHWSRRQLRDPPTPHHSNSSSPMLGRWFRWSHFSPKPGPSAPLSVRSSGRSQATPPARPPDAR